MRGPKLSQSVKAEFLNQGRVWIMGVLNVTPDSFYPDSRAMEITDALEKAERMIQEGADVLDIGGESTRPGASLVSLSMELERVIPLIDALRHRWPDIPISIDTQKAAVTRQALAHGASLVNDISALRQDPEMAAVISESDAPVVLMHMQGTPQTMQKSPHYENVMDDLKAFFSERLSSAVHAGIPEDNIILDPGIGFGKTLEHNVTILKRLSFLKALGRPLLIGVSRKSFIGKLLASPPTPLPMGEGSKMQNPLLSGEGGRRPGEALAIEDRLPGTLAATLWAVREGVNGLRVHDVGATRGAIGVWQAIQNA